MLRICATYHMGKVKTSIYNIDIQVAMKTINARTLMVHDLTVFQEVMYPGKAQRHRRAKVMFS